MKIIKTLLISLLISIILVVCSDKGTDCYCTITGFEDDIALYDYYRPTISDYDGDCEDITVEELPAGYTDIIDLGGSYYCTDVFIRTW